MKTVIRIVAVGAILAALLFFHQTYQRLKQREAVSLAAEQARKAAEATKRPATEQTAEGTKKDAPAAPKTLEPFVPSLPPAKDTPGATADGADKSTADKAAPADKATAEKSAADKAAPSDKTPPAAPTLASVPVAGADKADKSEKGTGANKSEKAPDPAPGKSATEPPPQLQAVPVK